MKRIITTLILTMLVFSTQAQNKGFYYEAGLTVTTFEQGSITSSYVSLGYSFDRHIIMIRNGVGQSYTKLASIEYNLLAPGLNDRLTPYLLVSVNPADKFIVTSKTKRLFTADKSFSGDIGAGFRFYFAKKYALNFSMRASYYRGTDHTTSKQKTITPMAFSLGISK